MLSSFFKTSFFLLFVIFYSCSSNQKEQKQLSNPQQTTYDSVKVKYSQRFAVNYYKGYKLINVFSDRNSNDTTFTYVLYQRGTAKPDLKIKAQYVEIPVNKVACLSSVYTGCMEKLGLIDKITAIDNADFICDAAVLAKVKKGEIKEVSKGTGSVNVEQILFANPELIITYGMGNPEKDMSEKITKAKLPVAISIEHLETSPLARAEWIKFVACFFNAEQQANAFFNKVDSSYIRLKQLTTSVSNKPSVLTEMKYGDIWFAPGGKSFMAELLNDAGANYLWKENDKFGSLQLSFEEVYQKSIEVDYWLNLIFCKSKQDILKQDKRYADFKAFKTGNVYNNNLWLSDKGGNAYWESGLIAPNEILADMIFIFHPELLPQHQLKYYQKLQ